MARLLTRLERIPPFLCRLLARKNHGLVGLTHLEIAKRSGLSRSTIAAISYRTTWVGIPVDTVDRFASACGVDHLHADQQVDFIKRRQLGTHILRANNSQKYMYRRLFALLDKWAKPKSPEPSAG